MAQQTEFYTFSEPYILTQKIAIDNNYYLDMGNEKQFIKLNVQRNCLTH